MARDNNLGIAGWFYAGRYGLPRYAYTLQRITGIGIILYLPIHLWVVGHKISGKSEWDAMMATVRAIHFGEYLVFMAILIHALNGLRLIWTELGMALGQPIRNIYPYQTCLDRNRVFFLVILALIFILGAVGTADFLTIIQ